MNLIFKPNQKHQMAYIRLGRKIVLPNAYSDYVIYSPSYLYQQQKMQLNIFPFSNHRPSRPMLSISLNVRLCVCLFTFEVPFNNLFTPTSRNRMSNIFRDSESLGKTSGKKWSQIWTFLFENCLKSPRKKKFFFSPFFTFEVPFNGLFAPTSRSRMSNIFRD